MKVCVVTGGRSDYGLLRPLMRLLRDDAEIELQIIVTGMHLDATAGQTETLVEADGFVIAARVLTLESEDTLVAATRAIGRGVLGCVDAFEELGSDVVIVLGDRHEILAATIAATYSGRIVAHIHGGDVSGGYDQTTRHAITKMAHIHFPATLTSAQRILAMGERPETVHVVGAPGLDVALQTDLPGIKDVLADIGAPNEPFLLVVMHPDSTRPDESVEAMQLVLNAALATGKHVVSIGSNLDPGGRRSLDAWASLQGNMTRAVSLPHETYLALLKGCDVLVGNSSSGIIEAAAFETAVVNVGDRQAGRERPSNVIDAPLKSSAILDAITTALSKDFQAGLRDLQHPYGDGQASRRMVSVLKDLPDKDWLIRKPMA